MKRWHDDFTHMCRQWKTFTIIHGTKKSKGYFRKKKSFDCGNSQCYICHSDKYPKRELTQREKISLLNFKEQRNED